MIWFCFLNLPQASSTALGILSPLLCPGLLQDHRDWSSKDVAAPSACQVPDHLVHLPAAGWGLGAVPYAANIT